MMKQAFLLFLLSLLIISRLTRPTYAQDPGAFVDILIQERDYQHVSDFTIGQDGMVYIAEPVRQEIRRYNAYTGGFVDVFIDGRDVDGGIAYVRRLLIGKQGDLFVLRPSRGHKLMRFDGTSGQLKNVLVPDSSTLLPGPYDIAQDEEGMLYISDTGTRTVVRIDPDTGALIDTFIPTGSGGLEYPQYLAFGPDNHLYVTDRAEEGIWRFDGTTGAFIDVFIPPYYGGLINAHRPYFAPDGFLYISSIDSKEILRFDPATGAFIDVAITLEAAFDEPRSLHMTSDGYLYIQSRKSGIPPRMIAFDFEDYVRAYDTETGQFVRSAQGVTRPIRAPVEFLFGLDELLYLSTNNGIQRYQNDSGAYVDTPVPMITAGLQFVTGMTMGSKDELYVSNGPQDEVMRFNPQTGVFIDFFVPFRSGGLDAPRTLLFSPEGDLLVLSAGTEEVLRYDGETGAFIGIFVSPDNGELERPFDMTYGPEDDLYITSSHPERNEIWRYDGISGAFIEVYATLPENTFSRFSQPEKRPQMGPDGHLYVGVPITGRIYRIDHETREATLFTTLSRDVVDRMGAFQFGQDGLLYVTDRSDHQFVRYAGPVATSTASPLPLEDIFLEAELYPNPTRTAPTLSITLAAPSPVEIRVFAANGQEVFRQQAAYLSAGNHLIRMNTASLSSGLYLYRISTGETLHHGRFVLRR